MSNIIIPEMFIETKNSETNINSEIDFSTWIKCQKAFENPTNAYIMNICPKNNRKIKYSLLAPSVFNHFKIYGKFILNIDKIDTFSIDFISSYLSQSNFNRNQRYNEYNYENKRRDFLFNKDWEINGNNLDLCINIDTEEWPNDNEIVFYKRDLLPVDVLTINCNQARIMIKNQDIKKLIINNKDPHCFNLILKNLTKLEYLDISKATRFDLIKYPDDDFKYCTCYSDYYLLAQNNRTLTENYNRTEHQSCPVNYFNVDFINSNCEVKLNTNLCFYFQINNPLTDSKVFETIPIFPRPPIYNNWFHIYISTLFNCNGKKTINVKWKTLQKKLLLKINELISNKLIEDSNKINKYYKSNKKEN